MAKAVVTGGAGFIGSHLTQALLAHGFEVHVLDNLSFSTALNVPAAAILHRVDIRDFSALLPVFHGADVVFHLAALPRVQPSIEDPRTAHEVNSTGTLNVLVAARDAGIPRVVYAASSAAYGNQEALPLREDMPACPMSPYALAKYYGERACRLFTELYGLKTVSLRYFNVYGPRMPARGAYAIVIGRFLEQRSRGEPMTVVPDGTQSRDFTHVRDAVRSTLLAAESPAVGRGEVINVGTGRSHSVLGIAQLIGGPTVFIEPRVEPKHVRADVSRAKELLGWEPEIGLEEGIAELKKLAGIA